MSIDSVRRNSSRRSTVLRASTLAMAISSALLAPSVRGEEAEDARAAHSTRERNATLENVTVEGARLGNPGNTTTRLPLTIRETPQSVSEITREYMDLASMTDVNDVLMNVTGVNVSLYDTQRPLYFARGFQITDFQVDGLLSYSSSTNQEYDTALYERVEVIRGANGLVSGTGTPSATVNLIRKRPQREFHSELSAAAGSWDMKRVVGDMSLPLFQEGRVRSRVVVAYQDADSFRDRYQEDKLAVLGVLEGDITDNTRVAIGFQKQDNNPTGTIWGTIPLYTADGGVADMPVSTSFSPTWTKWQRESSTAFVNFDHGFNSNWNLKAVYDRTEGDVSSVRVYASGFPDRQTGAGTYLLAAVGAGDDTRDSADVYVTGRYSAFGREHDVTFGVSASRLEATTPLFTSVASWRYDVPNAWAFDGTAPQPTFRRTGAYRIATTDQAGVYASTRFRVLDPLSLVAGARLSWWETSTDNFNTARVFTATTGAYEIDKELTPYVGLVYDIGKTFSLYASYTDVFKPQSNKDKNNDLLEPVLGSNIEAGVKGEFLDRRLIATLALFQAKQDNYAVRDSSQPDGSLPDGSSAYIGVDGTRSKGVEASVSGQVSERWLINAGYTFVETKRHTNDLIWTNLPEHYVQLSTHVQLPGVFSKLTLGGGVNWQSETIGYNIVHPTLGTTTFRQGAYALANLHATWQFNPQMFATLSATNLFDEKYWANIDYANYGEPRNVSLTMKWRY